MAISESVLQRGILSLLFPTPSSLGSTESQKKAGDLQGLCLQTVGSVRPEEGGPSGEVGHCLGRWRVWWSQVARLKRTWFYKTPGVF